MMERLHDLIDLWMQVSFWDRVLAGILVVGIVVSALGLLICYMSKPRLW